MSNESSQVAHASFAEMMATAQKNRAEAKIARSRTSSAEHTLAPGHKLESLKIPSIPPTPKKLDNDEIKDVLSILRVKGLVLPIGALDRDKLDQRRKTKAGKKAATFSTNEMVFSNFGKDGEFINIARNVNADDYPDTYDAYVEDLLKTMDYIGSSGSMSGLLNRLVLGLTEAPRVGLHTPSCIRWVNSVLKYKEVSVDYRGKSIAEMIDGDPPPIKFNKNSSAGVPYYCKISEGDTFAVAVEVATEVLNSIAHGTYNQLMTELRPSLAGVMLKNKQDYYQIERLGDKIRPYFVYPFHERLLYSAIQTNLKAVRFDEEMDGHSGSAVGFSWNYGGGDKLYNWIISRISMGPGFYPLFYGDDQLWVIVTVYGQVLICTPDFSHMDLSLCDEWGQVAYKVWKKSFPLLDKTWDTILKLNCKRAFVKQVIVESSMCFQFKHGLGSGVPGTTKFDEIASAAANGFIKESFEATKDAITDIGLLGSFLGYMAQEVKRIFGLIFKDGSLNTTVFTPDQPFYSFEFLGQTLVRVAGNERLHYIPKPNQWKLLLAATTYKKAYKSPMIKQKCSMAKYRSLYAGGGFLHHITGKKLKTIYQAMLSRGIRPMGEDNEDWATETESSVFVDIPFDKDDHSFPSTEWCMNLYLPPDDQVQEDQGITMKERLESEPSEFGYKEQPDFGLDEFGTTSESGEDTDAEMAEKIRRAINPSDWIAQENVERSPGVDIGVTRFVNPPEVPASTMQGLQPLPEAQKRAFEAAEAEKRQAMKDQRVLSSGVGKKSVKGAKKVTTKKQKHAKTGGGITGEDFVYDQEDVEGDSD